MTVSRSIAAEERAPQWAVAFLRIVSEDYNLGFKPPLRWRTERQTAGEWSSRGHTRWENTRLHPNECYIYVSAGTDLLDQIQVLLHEAAHWVAGHAAHHGDHFWRTYWQMVKKYELPFYYCYYRSARYRSNSEWIAKRMYKIPAMIDMQLTCYANGTQVFRPEPFYAAWMPDEFPWRQLCKITLGLPSNPAPGMPRIVVETPLTPPDSRTSDYVAPANNFFDTSDEAE